MWILGGPNGAGKTTLASEILDSLVERPIFINADEVAQRLSPGYPENAALQSGKLIIKRRNELIRARQSFAIETTMSGVGHLNAAARAKDVGWRVGLIFVWLQSADLAVNRVALRYNKGGHGIPEDVVRRRYDRTARNFLNYQRLADKWTIVDNSADSPVWIAEGDGISTSIEDVHIYGTLIHG